MKNIIKKPGILILALSVLIPPTAAVGAQKTANLSFEDVKQHPGIIPMFQDWLSRRLQEEI